MDWEQEKSVPGTNATLLAHFVYTINNDERVNGCCCCILWQRMKKSALLLLISSTLLYQHGIYFVKNNEYWSSIFKVQEFKRWKNHGRKRKFGCSKNDDWNQKRKKEAKISFTLRFTDGSVVCINTRWESVRIEDRWVVRGKKREYSGGLFSSLLLTSAAWQRGKEGNEMMDGSRLVSLSPGR